MPREHAASQRDNDDALSDKQPSAAAEEDQATIASLLSRGQLLPSRQHAALRPADSLHESEIHTTRVAGNIGDKNIW